LSFQQVVLYQKVF